MFLSNLSLGHFVTIVAFAALLPVVVTAKHSVCSWRPFTSTPAKPEPTDDGWQLWCTAYPNNKQYKCSANGGDVLVADLDKLAPQVLELGGYTMIHSPCSQTNDC